MLQHKQLALKCFLQNWYDLCYNHKQLLWNVSCNIGMTCVTTQTVALNCFLQHWYDLCYNTNSCSELFLVTMVWLVLQHKQLGLNCFLQHWYDLCYNTNSCSEMFLATWVWLVLQHKQLAQVIPMLQEIFQSNCLCYNTSHINVVRNISDQLFVL